jgi:hypothetical protein
MKIIKILFGIAIVIALSYSYGICNSTNCITVLSYERIEDFPKYKSSKKICSREMKEFLTILENEKNNPEQKHREKNWFIIKAVKLEGGGYKIHGWVNEDELSYGNAVNPIMYNFIDNHLRLYENYKNKKIFQTIILEQFEKLKKQSPNVIAEIIDKNKQEWFQVKDDLYRLDGWFKGKKNGKKDNFTDMIKDSGSKKENKLLKGASWGFIGNKPYTFKDGRILGDECNDISQAHDKFDINNSLIAKIKYDKNKNHSSIFQTYTYDNIFLKELSKRAISSDFFVEDEFVLLNAKKISDRLIELEIPKHVKLLSVDKQSKVILFKVRILIVASSHAAKLASISSWDGDWGKHPVDNFLYKQIEWLIIDESRKLIKQQPVSVSNFKSFSGKPKKNHSILSKLDKIKFFEIFSDFLTKKNYGHIDYIIILKDNWDVDIKGIEKLITQLNKLEPIGFNILSTKTQTNNKTRFETLADEVKKGRYYESKESERITIKGGIADKINGAIRSHYYHRIYKHIDISGLKFPTSIFINKDDTEVKVENLITLSNIRIMLDLIKSLKKDDIKKELKKYNMKYEKDKNLDFLFEKWFMGFQIPPSSPIKNKSLILLTYDAQDKTSDVRKVLDKIEKKLSKISEKAKAKGQKDCSIHTIPLDIFRVKG